MKKYNEIDRKIAQHKKLSDRDTLAMLEYLVREGIFSAEQAEKMKKDLRGEKDDQ